MQTKTNYKSNYKTPLAQKMQNKASDFQNPKNPVYQEIAKNVGTFDFTATIQQDTQTLERFKNIPGLVAFLCLLKRDGQTVGEGRGAAVLNQANRFIERTIRYAFNASLIDAVVRSVKSLDTLHIVQTQPKDMSAPIEELYQEKEQADEQITDKQRSYLTELVHLNVGNEEDRRKWESSLNDFSKAEASDAIAKFKQ